jgi:putative CocE/NonD family hydrolase
MIKLNKIHVPVYHVGGFYDIFEAGVLKSYEGLENVGGKGARGNQKLLMGPWTHLTLGKGGAGTPWQQNAALNLDDEAIRWFDYWLKGEKNHIMDEPRVKYYVTGENQWQTASRWPLAKTQMTSLFLNDEKSGTINSLNDGSLSFKWPSFKEASNTYPYDPMHPIMTLGGNNLEILAGPMDQRPIEQNVLTFTSKPLNHNLTIAGPISAKLFVSSTAVDTDFTVKVTDVVPDGTSINLEDGIIRTKERNGQDTVQYLKPGKVYSVTVNLTGISHQFQPGHRIRVDTASSNYPRFDRNNNTAGQGVYDAPVIAQNTIYHDAFHPSAIFLPVIPGWKDHK